MTLNNCRHRAREVLFSPGHPASSNRTMDFDFDLNHYEADVMAAIRTIKAHMTRTRGQLARLNAQPETRSNIEHIGRLRNSLNALARTVRFAMITSNLLTN